MLELAIKTTGETLAIRIKFYREPIVRITWKLENRGLSCQSFSESLRIWEPQAQVPILLRESQNLRTAGSVANPSQRISESENRRLRCQFFSESLRIWEPQAQLPILLRESQNLTTAGSVANSSQRVSESDNRRLSCEAKPSQRVSESPNALNKGICT